MFTRRSPGSGVVSVATAPPRAERVRGAAAHDRPRPRSLGRRLQLERRLGRAPAPGLPVLTPPNLLRGVAVDAAYVGSFLAQRTEGPVVLVGHSYGGVVVTNAGTAGGDVRALVYVDAFIPQVGESVFDVLGGSGSALDVPDPAAFLDLAGYPGAPEGDIEAFLKPSTVHESFAQDLPEAQRWLIAASQRPIALGANISQPDVTVAAILAAAATVDA